MPPELSIIIPTFNEQLTLPCLLDDLSQQQDLVFEIIIVDGGSSDATLDAVNSSVVQDSKLAIQYRITTAGRATQMNQGAQIARASQLLFLHADSRLPTPDLLINAYRFFSDTQKKLASQKLAAHFGLEFIREQSDYPSAYYFYAAKTRLNRPDCINGDQGIWLHQNYFQYLGGYDETLTYMEDARLARKIFATGTWITLPGYIATSARRFEIEGLKERQTLNAFMCNFDNMDFDAFFIAAKSIYRTQAKTTKLILKPYLLMIHHLMFSMGLKLALKYWYLTGAYVVDNAWQLAFAVDCRHNRKNNLPPGKGPTKWLTAYDTYVRPVITLVPGRAITALLTAFWFYYLLVKSLIKRE